MKGHQTIAWNVNVPVCWSIHHWQDKGPLPLPAAGLQWLRRRAAVTCAAELPVEGAARLHLHHTVLPGHRLLVVPGRRWNGTQDVRHRPSARRIVPARTALKYISDTSHDCWLAYTISCGTQHAAIFQMSRNIMDWVAHKHLNTIYVWSHTI